MENLLEEADTSKIREADTSKIREAVTGLTSITEAFKAKQNR